MWVLTRASISCIDETGLLAWSDAKFANECRLTIRSLETHLPRLTGSKLLERANDGFRVAGWLASENFSENFSEKKERTKERKESGVNMWELTPPSPSRVFRDFKRERETVAPLAKPAPEDMIAIAICRYCDPPHEFATDPYLRPVEVRACPEFAARFVR